MTLKMVNPAVCAAGVVPSAPRMTSPVAVFSTAMFSPGTTGSFTRTTAGGLVTLLAAGTPDQLAAVQISGVPAAGAPVPPALTVVDASAVKISIPPDCDPTATRMAAPNAVVFVVQWPVSASAVA